MIKTKMLTSIILKRTGKPVRYGEEVELTKEEYEYFLSCRLCAFVGCTEEKKETPKKKTTKKKTTKEE